MSQAGRKAPNSTQQTIPSGRPACDAVAVIDGDILRFARCTCGWIKIACDRQFDLHVFRHLAGALAAEAHP